MDENSNRARAWLAHGGVLVFDDDLDAAKSLLESNDLLPPSPAS